MDGRPLLRGEKTMTQPVLHTARLTLRPFTPADAPVVTELLQVPAIADNTLRIPFPYQRSMADEWIATHPAEYDAQREVTFAITLADDRRFIGAVGLVLELPHRQAELGYWLGEPWWGRGYASEAARAVVGWGFDVLDLNRIHAGFMAHNPASGGVLSKLGLQHEGLRREHIVKNGRPVDLVLMGLLRRDWRG